MTDPDDRIDSLPHDHRRARRPQTERRLRRSRNAVLAGVAAGIAEFVDAQVGAVRWIFALSVPLTIGLSVVVYLLLWLLLPRSPPERPERSTQR